MASHIPLVEDGHVIGLDGKPLAAAPINGWPGFPFEVHPHMRKGEVAHRYNLHPMLFVRRRTHGRSRIRSGTNTYDLALAPGQVDVFSCEFRMDYGWWDCTPGELIAVDLDPLLMRNLLHDDARPMDLRTSLSGRDPILEQLVECIRLEVDGDCPSGRLYADGLSLALVACLRARHSISPAPRRRVRRLSARQMRITRDHIEANLASDLSVSQLCALHDMSPWHFARLFKATTGTAPHRFVLDRRLEAAGHLLAGDLPLADIALAVGFSSQSHFTEAFRTYTGTTPGRARSP